MKKLALLMETEIVHVRDYWTWGKNKKLGQQTNWN